MRGANRRSAPAHAVDSAPGEGAQVLERIQLPLPAIGRVLSDFGGVYAAVVLTFRFAAADCVPAAERPRALAIVLAGGVAAGIVGSQLVTLTMGLVAGPVFVMTGR